MSPRAGVTSQDPGSLSYVASYYSAFWTAKQYGTYIRFALPAAPGQIPDESSSVWLWYCALRMKRSRGAPSGRLPLRH